MKKLNRQIGKAIKSLRIQKELTQEELAEASGVHEKYIGRIEQGVQGISLEYLEKLAKGLKLSVPEITRVIYSLEGQEIKDDRDWLIENICSLVRKQTTENLKSFHDMLLQLPLITEQKPAKLERRKK